MVPLMNSNPVIMYLAIMQVQTYLGICTIREAVSSDLPQLVAVHVTSFNATYPDYHPKPGFKLREQQWQLLLAQKPDRWFCYVLQPEGGPLAGFATGHAFHDPALPYKGQLDKIHILKPYQGLGFGSLLMFNVVNRFLQQEIDSMILFADPANPAIRFYDVLGGERLLLSDNTFDGAFGWKDLNGLARLLLQRTQ